MLRGSGRRLVYLHSHPSYNGHLLSHAEPERLVVTISSQAGSGAMCIAERLAALFQIIEPSTNPPWQVFDRSLMGKVLEDHRLPRRLAKFLPEDANNPVDEVLDQLFGLHPSSELIVQNSIETILQLAKAGHVILVGWGANVITRKLPNVFHVRLVGSLEKRLQRIEHRDHLSRKEAMALITRQDRGRERYVKKYFRHDLSDTLLYHFTINTDRFSEEQAAQLICITALNRCCRQLPQATSGLSIRQLA